MAFYLDAFHREIPNDSAGYNYQEWNAKHRFSAADHLKRDPRPLPKPTGPIDPAGATAVVCEVGGLIVVAGGQLHASVPNDSGKTRFSIDFRTVNRPDLEVGVGAPATGVHCTGSLIGDFKRCTDLADLPAEITQPLIGRV